MTSPPSAWRSVRRTAERWLSTWPREPVLLADAFQRVPDPLEPVLMLARTGAPAAVAGAIAGALIPSAAPDAPPPWLRPDQEGAFRRAVAGARRYGGALIAEPAGTGKTWIGLAAARALTNGPVVALVPAALISRWRTLARELGVRLEAHSHEAVSRGRLPRSDPEVVIIDESHRFRHHRTRRYLTTAPWLVGRRGLLLSATPVVNQSRDLAHQLRLFVRDDALAAAGLRSLQALGADPHGHEALAEIVVAGWAEARSRPGVAGRSERVRQDRWLGRVLGDLDRLRLSTHPGIASLVRTTLWGAAASSPAALAAALLRYLALLDQAEDAARAGSRLSREALRRFLASDPAQLMLWELLPQGDAAGDLVVTDRPKVAALRAEIARRAIRGDNKLRLLRDWLADGRPSLVFSRSVATVEYLRQQLGPAPVAWCTGTRAGIGPTPLTRESVLAWFAPGAPDSRHLGVQTPRILVTTDVAAEGLDLQGADRVVHYDLPWTATRVDQRLGRVRRLGSRAATVQECWILPPRSVERRLGQEGALAVKRRLPDELGVGEASEARWRQRVAVARSIGGDSAVEGIACVKEGAASVVRALACARIESASSGGVTRLYVYDSERGWQVNEGRALELLRRAAAVSRPHPAPPDQTRALIEELAGPVRVGLREAAGRQWEPGQSSPEVAILLRRVRHWARIAARARDDRLLERLDAAVRGLGQGRTAGEEIRLAHLASRASATVHEHLREIPAAGPALALPRVRLVGMVVFGGTDG